MRRTGKSHTEAEWQIKIKTIGLRLSNKHRNQLLVVLSHLRACRYVFCLAFVDHGVTIGQNLIGFGRQRLLVVPPAHCPLQRANHFQTQGSKQFQKFCHGFWYETKSSWVLFVINQLLSQVVIILPLEWKHCKLWHAFADKGDFSYKPVIVHIQNITRSWEVCSSKPYSFLEYLFYKESVSISCCVYAN